MLNKTLVITLLLVLYSHNALSSDYGITGLIDTPTARMQPDATLSTALTHDRFTESYMMTYQAFDWLEATYRYTGFKTIDTQNWDRNYEVKARLLKESALVPAISLGIRDLVGTGVFGAEYIVASKKYNNFDLSLGLGWGVLSGKKHFANPFDIFDDKFNERTFAIDTGGTIPTETFFRGKNTSLFGGISYRFDNYPLTLKVEYDSNELVTGAMVYDETEASSPINIGVSYHYSPSTTLSLNYKHNDTVGINITSRINTASNPVKTEQPIFISSRDPNTTLPNGFNPKSWYDLLLYDVERANLFLMKAELFPSEKRATLEISNQYYSYWPDALDVMHRLASLHLPSQITNVDYVINVGGHKFTTIRLPRESWQSGRDISVARHSKILPGRVIVSPNAATNFVSDKLNLDISIANQLLLFDPDQPLSYQFYVSFDAAMNLPSDWRLVSSYRYNLYHNFDELTRYSNSQLPAVRTDSLRYLQQGDSGLAHLFLDKRGTFTNLPALHYRMYGGILESMYSGFGGEVLFQPHQSRLAFGLSANAVQKRAFNGTFKHLDYKTITAFASVYWASPFNNYDFALHAGRYLAKDLGATLEVRRTFDNGWQVGAWATLTDVPFEVFGEGSFDKGFFLRIPLGNVFNRKTRSVIQTEIRPIQRDGGARLPNHSSNIWWDSRDVRYDLFSRSGLYR